MTNGFDITAIENAVGDAIYGLGVSKNVFANRPASSTKDLTDFVVCRISGPVVDRCALGECNLAISLFAKDVSNMKNGKKLSVMEQKLRAGLPYEIGDIVFKPYSYRVIGDTADGNGYHARVVTIATFLKK